MEMNFIHPKDQPYDSSARITLGPLECVEASKLTGIQEGYEFIYCN